MEYLSTVTFCEYAFNFVPLGIWVLAVKSCQDYGLREPSRILQYQHLLIYLFKNYEQETIVHVSNRIAVTMLSLAKGILTQHSMDFIKACLTFNEITIPSIRSVLKRSHLYIETAEVSCGCLYWLMA